jgi:hypothetical protein
MKELNKTPLKHKSTFGTQKLKVQEFKIEHFSLSTVE